MAAIEGIRIRPLSRIDEIDAVVALQRAIWNDPTTVIYAHMLISLVRNGGLLLGAFNGDTLVGFLLGYLGTDSTDSDRPAMANLKMVSQRMAVLPEYRGGGLGNALKLAQRDYAIKLGIRLITWTFDPLNSRNAHLNIRKLGCIVQVYERNYYGTQELPLVSLGQSDRLVADWRITTPRVELRLSGTRGPLSIDQYLSAGTQIVNPSVIGANGLPQPGTPNPTRSMLGLVEIPANFDQILHADEGLARAWRAHGREVFTQALSSGYIVTDFIRAALESRDRSFYLLSAADGATPSGFSAN